MLSFEVRVGLFLFGVLGLLALAVALKRERTGPAVFLYLVPIAWSAVLSDLCLEKLSHSFPALEMNGDLLDWPRFALALILFLIPTELLSQSLLVWYCGAGPQDISPEDS